MPSRREAAHALLDSGYLDELAELLDARYWREWKAAATDDEMRAVRNKVLCLADLIQEVNKAATEVLDYGGRNRAASAGE